MRRYIVAILVTITGYGLLFQTAASALSTPSQLIITEVRLGGEAITRDGAEYKQYVTLYNQSDTPVQLDDGWTIEYAKADFEGTCDQKTWNDDPPALAGTVAPNASVTVDYQLTDEAPGVVRIIDAERTVHDLVGWGAAPCAETKPVAAVPKDGRSIIRYALCDGSFIGSDTNDNSRDFATDQEPFAAITALDCTPECTGGQVLENGACVDDLCNNILGVQTTIPEGYRAENGECHEIILEPAPEPPATDPLPLIITELLPNATGTDKGNEFVELYNPNETAVDLSAYALVIGDDADKMHPLSADETVAGGEYVQIKDTDAGFTLPNTQAKVTLRAADGQVLSEAKPYENPDDNTSWALIDHTWQYTNQPTPSAANVISTPQENDKPPTGNGGGGDAELKPCAANQERNPETNRCRLIEQDGSSAGTSLVPCKEGQYRSEETNRCRSTIAASTVSTLTPCSVGQERNPETNRCRSIGSSASSANLTPCKPGQERNPTTNRCRSTEVAANDLVPCKEGQERNPDTNRCRTAAATDVPKATFAAEPIADTGKSFTGWWILGVIGALALGRIGWEWRNEIGAGIRKVGTFFTPGK